MTDIIIAIIGSGALVGMITHLFTRKKLRAETSKIRAEKDNIIIGQYRQLMKDAKEQWERQMSQLRKEVDFLKEKEVEILRQNTLILEHNRDLSKRLTELEKENKKLVIVLDNTTKKLRRYEAALKKKKIPEPQ